MFLPFFIKIRTLKNKLFYKTLGLLRLFNGYSCLYPKQYLVMLTYACNLNCPYCIIDRVASKYLEFTLASFKSLEQNCLSLFSLRKTRYTLMGGEPTVAKDFLPIMEYLSNKKHKISIITNGCISEQLIQKLTKIDGLDRIFISLHLPDYQKTLTIIELFKKYIGTRRVNLYLNCTINYILENKFSLKNIARKFENSGLRHIRFQHSMSIFSLNEKHDLELLKKQIGELKNTSFKTNVFIYPDVKIDDIDNHYLNENYPGGFVKCVFPWTTAVVIPNGDVVPCFCNKVMGNLYENNIREIWNGNKYINFRRNIQKNRTNDKNCCRCVFREF